MTCAPNHPKGKLYDGFRNALFQREHMDGIDVVRVWTFLAANEGVVLRSLNYLSFLLSATAQAWRLSKARHRRVELAAAAHGAHRLFR